MHAPQDGKRIGFVDFDLNNFHANKYLALLKTSLAPSGFAVSGAWAVRCATGRQWASSNGVPYCETPEALNERADAFIVLAPSNPEVHLDLCRKFFPFGKPTYVDKTFAPDLATARRIFDLADRRRVPMQTSSALRYTNIQQYVKEQSPNAVKHMVAWGGGRSFEEYAIHPVELVVSCMGHRALSLLHRKAGSCSQLLINFTAKRTAVVNVYVNTDTRFAAAVTTARETRYLPVEGCDIFRNTAEDILRLFATSQPAVDRRETLMIRRILDVAGQKRALRGFASL